jgi:hypothetical protein
MSSGQNGGASQFGVRSGCSADTRGFRDVHVFDIFQTEGEALPNLDAVPPKLLDADAPEGIWDAPVDQARVVGLRGDPKPAR